MTVKKSIGTWLLCSLLAGCSQQLHGLSSEPRSVSLYDYQLTTADHAPLTLEAFSKEVKDADVILVGEWHTHSGVHLFQAQLLAMLNSAYPDVALSMEQFTRNDQAVLDEYLAGKFGENSLLSKTSKWSNYEGSYRPLVEYAKAHSVPVIASNAPIEIVRCIGREGKAYLDRLPQEKRGLVAETLSDGESPYKEKFFAAMFHGNETKTGNQYLAQLAWDDTMAESIVNYLAEHPNDKVMHIAGAFHVENGLGIAARITARNPELKVAIVSPQSEEQPLGKEVKDFRLVVNPLPPQWLSDDEMNAAMKEMRHSYSGKDIDCE
ncbi:hypothetical protein D515_03236 [Grimontia indica]|uniref:Haem-binding uptake Tiki superfamily ChaN domain-containing protein n=1 Tax=Grimontia indica TaxID=1056512 RepID=R1IKM2_9GAMM|nr:ChaN family lipoprotein [Grimontia indica]EOD78012.1 hypothetical protein D515_03236 [Grimontia indica]